MKEDDSRCPFLVPVLADRLWVSPVSAYCRPPHGTIRLPGGNTLMRICSTPRYASCPGYVGNVAHLQRATDQKM